MRGFCIEVFEETGSRHGGDGSSAGAELERSGANERGNCGGHTRLSVR